MVKIVLASLSSMFIIGVAVYFAVLTQSHEPNFREKCKDASGIVVRSYSKNICIKSDILIKIE